MTFTHRIGAEGPELVIALYGEMDLRVSEAFEATVHRILAERRPRVLQLDLAGLDFLDSTGVSVIVRLWRLSRREHCSLRLVNSNGMVRHVLEVTGALTLVGEVPSAEAAPGVTS
ncbi:STAS domain-containing protein [Planosporangium sp. 12N6]|uniref:STAS domain-containing protein n=1 Tax=Planosporangium spinosum TaxID=3402278 RepID=UPI003CFBA878